MKEEILLLVAIGIGKSVPWQNFYIAANCFDKTGCLSKSYFQITVHEKLRVNDQWLQGKKTNVKLHKK